MIINELLFVISVLIIDNCIHFQICELRGKYGRLVDLLSARVKLAYPHAVQLLVDSFLIMTPVAQWSEVSFRHRTFIRCVSSSFSILFYINVMFATSPQVGYWALLSTAILTFFFQGLFNLAKAFYDPFANDLALDSDFLVIDTLIAETNAGSRRWLHGAARFPFGTVMEHPMSSPLSTAGQQQATTMSSVEVFNPCSALVRNDNSTFFVGQDKVDDSSEAAGRGIKMPSQSADPAIASSGFVTTASA